MRPATDLCDTCRENTLSITRAANFSQHEKSTKLEIAVEHLDRAKVQRNFYNTWREKAKTETSSTLLVLSFDFAENVSYPSSPQQVGSSYFKSAQKCAIFGILNEATNVQTNFLIDEDDDAGKGANAVISMLDSYLKNSSAETLVLFADNCVGQNKNNAVIDYLLWRMITGKNKFISLNFLLAGHTKFGPDRNFGILKAKYAISEVDCLQDFINV